jgi:hypothetical protein
MDRVINKRGRVFFVDGPGGIGKTFLYKALLAKVNLMGLIAVATATSGIAAFIMLGGCTAHSRLKIPIKLGDNTVYNFSKQNGTTALLRTTSLIICDYVAMTKRQVVETLDRTFQDIMDCLDKFFLLCHVALEHRSQMQPCKGRVGELGKNLTPSKRRVCRNL